VFSGANLELNPAAAILGGVLGGEIIKVVSVGWMGLGYMCYFGSSVTCAIFGGAGGGRCILAAAAFEVFGV